MPDARTRSIEPDPRSRYAGTPLITWNHSSGETLELRELREIPSRPTVFQAVPVEGDRLDLLAARYYRDPLLFWRIADAADALDPLDLVVPGEPLPVPPNKPR